MFELRNLSKYIYEYIVGKFVTYYVLNT